MYKDWGFKMLRNIRSLVNAHGYELELERWGVHTKQLYGSKIRGLIQCTC